MPINDENVVVSIHFPAVWPRALLLDCRQRMKAGREEIPSTRRYVDIWADGVYGLPPAIQLEPKELDPYAGENRSKEHFHASFEIPR